MKASDEVWVDAAPKDVFEFVADPDNLPGWMSGVKEARFGAGSEPGPGAILVTTCIYRGRTFRNTHEVTEFEPPSRFAFRTVEGPYPIASTFAFRPDDDGTLISYEHDVIADSPYAKLTFTLFWPLTRRMVKKRLAWELDELADLVEELEGEDTGGPGGDEAE